MTVETAIAYFRRRERQLMTSTVEVTRVTGPPSYDPGTGTVTEPVVSVYHGDALVRMNAWEGSDVQAGDTEVRLRTARAKLPADTLVLRDDLLRVIASKDARLVGRVYRITDVLVDDWQVSCAVFLEEVT